MIVVVVVVQRKKITHSVAKALVENVKSHYTPELTEKKWVEPENV